MKIVRFFALCGVLLGVAGSQAQTVAATGSVHDEQGAAVQGADIRILLNGIPVVAAVKSGKDGSFTVNIPADTYEVKATANGFLTMLMKNVQVPGKEIAIMMKSSPDAWGPVAEIPPVIATETSSSSALIAGGGVQSMPLSPVEKLSKRKPWEMGVLAQGGVGMTEERDSFRFLMAGVHMGKVLTQVSGDRLWSGQFEYAGELFPFWQSYTPKFQRANCSASPGPGLTQIGIGLYCSNAYTTGGTYTGTTITPIILRWNFTHGKRFMPWAQGAGGILWTNHKYPAFGSPVLTLGQDGPNTQTSVFNFTPQGGVGFHYFLNDRHSIDFSANGIHISSASLGDKNPGVNASVQFSLGYTWWSRK